LGGRGGMRALAAWSPWTMHWPPERPAGMLAAGFTLAALYGAVCLGAVVQFGRAHRRTTRALTKQKLFFLLTAICAFLRLGFFSVIPFTGFPLFLTHLTGNWYPNLAVVAMSNLPAYLFYSTLTLLILYWAEILARVRRPGRTSSGLVQPCFILANSVVYAAQVAIWALWGLEGGARDEHSKAWSRSMAVAQNTLVASVSVIAGLGFLYFGLRLLVLLRSVGRERGEGGRPAVRSKVLQARLREVGLLTVICTTSCLLRGGILGFCIFDEFDINFRLHGDMVVGQHSEPFCETSILFMTMYYVMSEVTPSFLLLYVLRDLPKKASTGMRRATESTPLVT